jgi:hypothetical protein
MTSLAPIPLPGSLLDILLRLAPLDVLLFDSQLVCRYAALTDGTFLGKTPDRLMGQPATAIFRPDQSDLHAALDLAARNAVPSSYPTYRLAFPGGTAVAGASATPSELPHPTVTRTGMSGTTDTTLYCWAVRVQPVMYCWAVRVQPVTFLDYQGREESRGVLVTLADVRDLADDNDHLRADNEELRRGNAALRQALVTTQHREETTRRALQRTVRSLLAPVVGYLQVVARRPQLLAQRSVLVPELLSNQVLPQLERLVGTVDTLSAPVLEASPPPSRQGRSGPADQVASEDMPRTRE